jgi:hypothetical protein
MKTKILFFILVFVGNVLTAQQANFEKTYQFLTNEEATKSCIEDTDGGYVIGIGPKLTTGSFIRDYALVKLNQFGDTVWYTTFFLAYHTTLQVVKKAPDNGYIAIGVADDSATGNQQRMLWVAKFDSLGYLTWTRFYSNPLFGFSNFSLSVDYVSNGNLFIRSGVNTFFNLDSNYNFVSYKIAYKYISFNGGLAKVLNIKKDSVFYFYSAFQPNGLLTPFTPKILKVNESGDTIGSIHIPNDTLLLGRIIKRTHSYFLNIGYKLLAPGQTIFHVTKIDTSGVKIWSKSLKSIFGNNAAYEFRSFCVQPNGNNVVVFGPKNLAVTTSSFIYCFNDNGDSLWTHFYKNDVNYKSDLLDIISTSDSGLLACGQIEEPNGNLKNYIVKTNSSGLILDVKTELLKKNKSYFHLYPNPANSYSSFHYIGSENALLRIIDLQGQLIFSKVITRNDEQFTIETDKFKAGFYICNVSVNGENLLTKKFVVVH